VKPVQEPNAHITSRFGANDVARATGSHKGIDIAAGQRTGIKVYAAYSGKVELVSSSDKGYGLRVLIKSDNGPFNLYGHLASVEDYIETNKPIKQGTVIGEMGNTGLCKPPGAIHLHFGYSIDTGIGTGGIFLSSWPNWRNPTEVIELYEGKQ
jgi:murein DD-endopeptidase MepM/ murein hydrolase activator NlpD